MRSFPVQVRTMDAELNFNDIEYKATGKDLFELICRTIGLREMWYFGLQFEDSKGNTLWLKHDKKIVDHDVVKREPRSFLFMVKFYPEDVSEELIQEVTQHLFFLQAKHDILMMNVYCPSEATVLLASYALQAKYGDYEEGTFQPDVLPLEELLPQRVVDQYQMTREMWAEKIKEYHVKCFGMARDEAEMEYLKIVQDLEMYGINYFEIKNKRNSDLWLGVTGVGLHIYEHDNRLTPKVTFPWNEIKNISYKDRKFVIKLMDKKTDFVFVVPKLKTNKTILELCVGNHELFMRRRKPDTMEVQQMKSQAREDRARKQAEREQLTKEKQLREEAQHEKEELQKRLHELQQQFLQSQEALLRSEETVDLLAEKVRIADEESLLLSQKAAESEAEKQRIQIAAIKTEEEKMLMERRAQEAELIAQRIVEECERRTKEAQQLKTELTLARIAEKSAREKYQDILRSSVYQDLGGLSYASSYSGLSSGIDDLHLESSLSLTVNNEAMCDNTDMDTLSREIEKERIEYMEKSKNLHDQLKELKSEIEVLKVEDKQSLFDVLHEQNVNRGENKYSTLGKVKMGSAKARVQFYEEL